MGCGTSSGTVDKTPPPTTDPASAQTLRVDTSNSPRVLYKVNIIPPTPEAELALRRLTQDSQALFKPKSPPVSELPVENDLVDFTTPVTEEAKEKENVIKMSSEPIDTILHTIPAPETLECKLCWEDLDATNYAEYKIHADDKWMPSGYCQTCAQSLIDSQWSNFAEAVGKETCKASLLRLCVACPLYVKDWVALPCSQHGKPVDPKKKPDGKELAADEKEPCPTQGQVTEFWFASTNTVVVPQLKNAPVGEARDAYIANLKEFAALLKDTEAEDGPTE